jgi:phosphotransferase system HPr-like phosphotransfer protein
MEKKDGYTIVDVEIGFPYGMGLTWSSRVCKQCEKYDKDVYMENLSLEGNKDVRWDAKRVLELMSVGAAQGDKVRVYVKGENQRAEDFAEILSDVLNCKGYYDSDDNFKRYKNNRVALIDTNIPGEIIDDSISDRFNFRQNKRLIEKLTGKGFSVETYKHLFSTDIQVDCKYSRWYDFIITHVPFNSMDAREADRCSAYTEKERRRAPYNRSLDKIEKIHKDFPRTTIIAFTGAFSYNCSDEDLHEAGVTHVLRKMTDFSDEVIEKNLETIVGWLEDAQEDD